jgi:hypothetical protein
MASMASTGYAAATLGLQQGNTFGGAGDDIQAQLKANLAEMQKRRRSGSNPTGQPTQFLSPAARDLFGSGLAADFTGGVFG